MSTRRLLSHHKRIHDRHTLPFGVHQHRVELDLGDIIAQPRREQRDLRDQSRQRRDVGLAAPRNPLSKATAFSSSSIALASSAPTGAGR